MKFDCSLNFFKPGSTMNKWMSLLNNYRKWFCHLCTEWHKKSFKIFNRFNSEGTTVGTSDLKSVYPTAGDNTWDWVATNYIRFCEYCCITIVHLQGDMEPCKPGWDGEREVHAAHTTFGKKMDLRWAWLGGDTPGPWPASWLAF